MPLHYDDHVTFSDTGSPALPVGSTAIVPLPARKPWRTANGRFWPVSDRRVSAVATSPAGLHLGLLGDLQRVVDLDPEVSDGAFKLGVPEQ